MLRSSTGNNEILKMYRFSMDHLKNLICCKLPLQPEKIEFLPIGANHTIVISIQTNSLTMGQITTVLKEIMPVTVCWSLEIERE